MKPIETVFDGYKFRSRLEARWAVFFKTLGIAYEYEKEGFDLDGTWYLPDFWLPQQQRWIEIKGQEPTGEELNRIQTLEDGTGYPSCLFYGLPGENEGYAYFTCAHESHGGKSESDLVQWKQCPFCSFVDVNLRHGDDCFLYSEVDGAGLKSFCDCPVERVDPDPRCAHGCPFDVQCSCAVMNDGRAAPAIIEAYIAARQARFEHGEKP